MGWGGKDLFDWEKNGERAMLLAKDYTQGVTPQHEFGHWLGLQDAYDTPTQPINPLTGVPVGVYPDYDQNSSIMDNASKASNNDIEMVVLAFQTGIRQNYQHQFFYEDISEAMGRGN
jgi:hypothetical protein